MFFSSLISRYFKTEYTLTRSKALYPLFIFILPDFEPIVQKKRILVYTPYPAFLFFLLLFLKFLIFYCIISASRPRLPSPFYDSQLYLGVNDHLNHILLQNNLYFQDLLMQHQSQLPHRSSRLCV